MRYDFMRRRLVIGYVVVLVGMVLVINYFVPYIWLRGHHHTAEFISVSATDVLLKDEDEANLKVLSQVHNNLVMVDTNIEPG